MEINFYGVRGSCPTPITAREYKEKVMLILDKASQEWSDTKKKITSEEIYNSLSPTLKRNIGGNTTCLDFISSNGNHFIFDMGTGIRELGNSLAGKAFTEGLDLSIFMTHTHWDHIQGWPFFKPAYSPKVNINFYSCIKNLQERLERQQWDENFPITLSAMASQKNFHYLEEHQAIQVKDYTLTPFPLMHPGSCTGYQISNGKKSVLFCTDVELRENQLETIQKWNQNSAKCEILIIDAQYSTEESEKKIGWGHTSVSMAVKAAEALGVKKVVLTHFEPDHTDEVAMQIIEDEIKGYEHNVEIIIAYEGLKLTVD
ncbi:MAG: MBL fold metallo-hydrolase [Leptospira sp.]|nr:MBL fold metallo-hydrolase [Leptospira sp.]NCS92936.1 MBL fold metallo-hydrolase [Leptospira sp.]